MTTATFSIIGTPGGYGNNPAPDQNYAYGTDPVASDISLVTDTNADIVSLQLGDVSGYGINENDFHGTLQSALSTSALQADGVTANFDPTTNTLTFTALPAFQGTISNSTWNTIIQSVTYTPSPQDTESGYLLTVTPNAALASGPYDVVNQNVQTDAICFYKGTLIGTPDGGKSVEMLEPGDLVLTTNGGAAPVRWLGRQTISTFFADKQRVLPIRIKAGALAPNTPVRDLLVSPDHAIFIDGALIHAGALVNGTSIIQESNVPRIFTYYHVELDAHALIFAEGALAESFVDNVDRLGFDNWAAHEAAFPLGKAIQELPYPRAKSRRQVPVAIRVLLAERAEAIGETSAVA